jgi:hypothetical protein
LLQLDSALTEPKADVNVDTLITFQRARSWLNAVAPSNVAVRFVSLAVFHPPMFPLNAVAPWKR